MTLELLQSIWFLLTAVLFIGYAILDGFDLGVGILHLFAKDEEERRISINSVGPFWDGNEVWLIAAGGALFAAFAPVYAAVWSGFYLALLLLLVALIARAIAFDFRAKVGSANLKRFFDYCFGVGSLLIALLLGVAFGDILAGVPIDARGEYVGTFFTLLRPYPLAVGLLTVLLFTMHGALWLTVKAEGAQQARMANLARTLWMAFVFAYVVVSSLTQMLYPDLFAGVGGKVFWWLSLALVAVGMLSIPYFLQKNRPMPAFLASSVMIAGIVGTAAATLFPVLVPSTVDPAFSLTAFTHSSSQYTLNAMFWIALIGVPLALVYQVVVYRAFRGKTTLTKDSY